MAIATTFDAEPEIASLEQAAAQAKWAPVGFAAGEERAIASAAVAGAELKA
jgi:hypothetical protein